MGTKRISKCCNGRTAACSLLACVGAGAILLTAALALAQEGGSNNARAPAEKPGLFGAIARWFDDQTSKVGSHLKGARSSVENFGHEAGIAAKTTVEATKDAAGAVTRIPTARVVTGHEKCAIAPNGAPDCVVAASAICKTKGFESGKSVDMTTAEICTAQVYISGRSSGEGCHTEIFVSRALCQ
jgi:hypothetical protein